MHQQQPLRLAEGAGVVAPRKQPATEISTCCNAAPAPAKASVAVDATATAATKKPLQAHQACLKQQQQGRQSFQGVMKELARGAIAARYSERITGAIRLEANANHQQRRITSTEKTKISVTPKYKKPHSRQENGANNNNN
jgi:hypothetical protein